MWMRTRVREEEGTEKLPGSRLLGRTHLASCLELDSQLELGPRSRHV